MRFFWLIILLYAADQWVGGIVSELNAMQIGAW